MLQAVLNGKLSPKQENMEDVLTSCVFGVFQYDESNQGIDRFLQAARGERATDRPFDGLQIQSIGYDFWPNWDQDGCQSCEPDVVLTLDTVDGEELLILVEVKYRSGKSAYATDDAEAPTDQLAKEWDNLRVIAAAEKRKPVLLYVTSDLIFPKTDIDDGATDFKELRTTASKTDPFACYWISWRSLYQMFAGSEDPLGKDLARFARKLGFVEFDGFSGIERSVGTYWRYRSTYEWKSPTMLTNDWRYES